ncbi:hypothetical protein F5Y04DRAFT_249400 [Hypomontagnella monticulosa]|nr:hypothetical protein F5Y04DRAFT_249400 [Hypomontagnella monticulosa]
MAKNDVAVLDMKRHRLIALEKTSVDAQQRKVDLPRWKRNVDVSLPEAPHNETVVTVDLWRLGLEYNVNRLLGNSQQLYVLKS